MSLTSVDIHNKEFKRAAFGGYDRNDVDEFLDLIIQEFERHQRQNADLKEEIGSLERRLEQYRNLEDTLNRTLIAAQETSDEIKANARKEAELILAEARLQAERLVGAGQAQAEKIMAENAQLQRATQVLRHQIRALLQAQLDMLDQALPTETLLEQSATAQNLAGRLPPAPGPLSGSGDGGLAREGLPAQPADLPGWGQEGS